MVVGWLLGGCWVLAGCVLGVVCYTDAAIHSEDLWDRWPTTQRGVNIIHPIGVQLLTNSFACHISSQLPATSSQLIALSYQLPALNSLSMANQNKKIKQMNKIRRYK